MTAETRLSPTHNVLAMRFRREAEKLARATQAVQEFCDQEDGPWDTFELIDRVAAQSGLTTAEVKRGLWHLTGNSTLYFVGNLDQVGK